VNRSAIAVKSIGETTLRVVSTNHKQHTRSVSDGVCCFCETSLPSPQSSWGSKTVGIGRTVGDRGRYDISIAACNNFSIPMIRIEETLRLFSCRFKHGIEIRRNYDRELLQINAYGRELNQVWTNLFDNAIDATDDRGFGNNHRTGRSLVVGRYHRYWCGDFARDSIADV
jgi:hypothetical protein